MDHARFLLPFVVMSLLGAGCSSSTEAVVPPDAPVYTITPTTSTHPGVTAPVTSELDSCLARTGATLVEIQSVNNNDTTAHGDIVTFAVSSDRRLAVAAQDGTVKFWSLEGFLGVAGGPVLTYGPEVPTAVAADLAWLGDRVAVATTGDGALLAHADVRATGHVTVRSMSGTDVVGPLAATVDAVHDLAFLPDHTLLVAGGLGAPWPPSAVVERWDATPGAPVQLVRYQTSGTDFVGVATSMDGTLVVAASADQLAVLDPTLAEHGLVPLTGTDTVGVVLTLGGHFALTAGGDGLVRAFDTSAGEHTQTAQLGVADPVAIRIDPAGELVFVASRGGTVHALACR